MIVIHTDLIPSLAPYTHIQETAKANLKFLRDAQGNISNLITVLNSKIEELDLNSEMDGTDGLFQNQNLKDRNNLKKSQLVVLRDNVSVLSTNLDALISRNEHNTTNGSFVDTVAIGSVINETKKMIEILDQVSNIPIASYNPFPSSTNQHSLTPYLKRT